MGHTNHKRLRDCKMHASKTLCFALLLGILALGQTHEVKEAQKIQQVQAAEKYMSTIEKYLEDKSVEDTDTQTDTTDTDTDAATPPAGGDTDTDTDAASPPAGGDPDAETDSPTPTPAPGTSGSASLYSVLSLAITAVLAGSF